MPKLKTNRGAKKRFNVLPGGKVKRGQANRRHILETKKPGVKRHLRGNSYVSKANLHGVRAMLPYG